MENKTFSKFEQLVQFINFSAKPMRQNHVTFQNFKVSNYSFSRIFWLVLILLVNFIFVNLLRTIEPQADSIQCLSNSMKLFLSKYELMTGENNSLHFSYSRVPFFEKFVKKISCKTLYLNIVR